MNRLRAFIQAVLAAAAMLGAAAVLGAAVRVFVWSAGLGG